MLKIGFERADVVTAALPCEGLANNLMQVHQKWLVRTSHSRRHQHARIHPLLGGKNDEGIGPDDPSPFRSETHWQADRKADLIHGLFASGGNCDLLLTLSRLLLALLQLLGR